MIEPMCLGQITKKCETTWQSPSPNLQRNQSVATWGLWWA